jgi:hypothetical protein
MALTEGTVDKSSIMVGDWSEVAVEYPIGSNNWLLVGNAPEAAFEVTKEIYDHISTAFPRTVDLRIPVRTDMKFTAQLEEIYAQNIRLILGQDPSNANPYVYIGALANSLFVTFRARRVRVSDGQIITVLFWKANTSGLLQLGGGDEAISSPVEFMALDDREGSYGGSTAAPLGYVHVPPKAV